MCATLIVARFLNITILAVILDVSGIHPFVSSGPVWADDSAAQEIAVVKQAGRETILVTNRLQSEDLADFTWVIPLAICQRPLVERMPPDVFSSLDWILDESDWMQKQGILHARSIAQVERELHATQDRRAFRFDVFERNSAAAQRWLDESDLQAENHKGIFLIVIRANPLILYQDDLDFLRQQDWLENVDNLEEKTDVALSSLYATNTHRALSDQVTRDILLKRAYEQSAIYEDPLNRSYDLLTRAEYNALVQKYGMDREILLRTFQFSGASEEFIDIWFERNYEEIAFYNGGGQRTTLFKRKDGFSSTHYGRTSRARFFSPGELDEIRAFFLDHGPVVYERSCLLTGYLGKKFREHPKVQTFRRLQTLLSALENGIRVSLKISFPSDELYIPAGILAHPSTASTTRLYVFGRKPLKGKTELFEITRWQSIGTAVKADLSRLLPVYDIDTMSILTHRGALVQRQDGIHFTEMTAAEKVTFSEQGRAQAKEMAREIEQAVGQGDLDKVKALVDQGAEVDGDIGGRLICRAVEYTWYDRGRARDIVSYLLANGANINTSSRNGKTPLSMAVEARVRGSEGQYVDLLDLLIKRGAELGVKPPKHIDTSLLIAAARSGKANVVTFLIEHGAAADGEDRQGETPLIVAAESGQLNIVRVLLSHGVDLDKPSRSRQTPLWRAARAGHRDVVTFLLENGASATTPFRRKSPAEIASESGHRNVSELIQRYETKK